MALDRLPWRLVCPRCGDVMETDDPVGFLERLKDWECTNCCAYLHLHAPLKGGGEWVMVPAEGDGHDD